MAENPRIEELRRRVQKDPASIAFAQLAEEYRRAGHYEDAIDICRTGLQTHPSYLSARVTLGRALIEMNDLENAEVELRFVLQHAAENLAAIRAMAEIHQRRGELTEALGFYKSALELARHDPDLEQTVDEISRTIAKAPAPASAPVALPEIAPALTPEQRSAAFLAQTFDLLDLDDLDIAQPVESAGPEPMPAEPVVAAALPEPEAQVPVSDLGLLEDFLNQLPSGVTASVAAEPVAAVAPLEPEAEPGHEHVVHAPPIDDLALLDDYLYQQGPGEDLWAAVDAAPLSVDENAERPAPTHMEAILNPALLGLERFLEAIHTYRQSRAV